MTGNIFEHAEHNKNVKVDMQKRTRMSDSGTKNEFDSFFLPERAALTEDLVIFQERSR